MALPDQIEALLFVAPKPLSVKKLAALAGTTAEAVEGALGQLTMLYNTAKRGIRILKNGDQYQMATAPEYTKLLKTLVHEEISGDLTRPQLETLTIIAYRGPVAKGVLEQIRGVNCTLILRNLMMRGLIESEEDAARLQTLYRVSFEFLRWLGVHTVQDLPDYEKLHADVRAEQVLALAATVAAPLPSPTTA
ncbi:SMC-Scp complex subunit ScpB [Candidatus Uhrbacteria bacterium]|nr:SMC-Scp complex subunit ScpB [Candidatus Uhrbacteria bacterium]